MMNTRKARTLQNTCRIPWAMQFLGFCASAENKKAACSLCCCYYCPCLDKAPEHIIAADTWYSTYITGVAVAMNLHIVSCIFDQPKKGIRNDIRFEVH